MMDLVARGWKSDNGFRSGYLGQLHETVKKHFPTTDIKAQPHIQSKITAWKKIYSSLTGIFARSGVGFNAHGDFKIDCDDDQWSQIVRQDPNARGMRGRSWPYWEQWQVIFGKDRAVGNAATDYMDAVNGLYSQDTQSSAGVGSAQSVQSSDEPIVDPDNATNLNDSGVEISGNTSADKPTGNRSGDKPSANNSSGKVPATAGGKKRKPDQGIGIESLIDHLEKITDATNARLECLSQRIGYEFDLSKARKEVYEVLGCLPGLTREQKFDAGEIILEKVERLDFFLGMPDDDRLAFVFRALAKYGSG